MQRYSSRQTGDGRKLPDTRPALPGRISETGGSAATSTSDTGRSAAPRIPESGASAATRIPVTGASAATLTAATGRSGTTRLVPPALAAAVAAALAGAVAAQQPVLEEVIVTGSAIRRADLDQALPVTVLSAGDIQATGVSNVNELIEKLPAMQNMTVAADSVGGGGGGVRTANLRGIGEQYTLSLLDGHRMAPATSGSTIDLSSIPLAAIERVEILKDGASALYGSDAIAGVVNFILKDSVEGITVSSRIDEPQAGGGESFNVDVVAGLGDLDADGYSLVLAYSREDQSALAAAEREFAKTGFVSFSEGGREYYFENSSANAIPGNALVYTEATENCCASSIPTGRRTKACARRRPRRRRSRAASTTPRRCRSCRSTSATASSRTAGSASATT